MIKILISFLLISTLLIGCSNSSSNTKNEQTKSIEAFGFVYQKTAPIVIIKNETYEVKDTIHEK